MIFTALAAAAALAASGAPDRVDDYIRDQMAQNHVPGLQLTIIRDGRIEKSASYGVASLEWGQPVDQDTAFQLASSTKPFTGVLLMRLVQEGKLSLDDPVSKWLPDTPPAWSGITIRRLATHTSGLPTGLTPTSSDIAPEYAGLASATPQQVVELTAKAPLAHAPGSVAAYGLTDYAVLTVIMERATGETYRALLDERVLRPLGMTSTRFAGGGVMGTGMARATEVIPHRAGTYAWTGDRQSAVDIFYPPWGYSSGGILSTAADLAKLFVALDEGRLLEPSTIQDMWTAARLPDGQAGAYAVGWIAQTYRGRLMVGHTGGGALSDIVHFPDQKLTVIVLDNQQNMVPHLAGAVADLVAPAPAPVHALIRDDDPALTTRLRAVLEGTAPAEMFTPETQQSLLPMSRQLGPMFVQTYGPVRTFALVDDKPQAGLRVRRFLVLYGDAPQKQLLVSFTLTPDGKVAALDNLVE